MHRTPSMGTFALHTCASHHVYVTFTQPVALPTAVAWKGSRCQKAWGSSLL